jgi:hypothetical protein
MNMFKLPVYRLAKHFAFFSFFFLILQYWLTGSGEGVGGGIVFTL